MTALQAGAVTAGSISVPTPMEVANKHFAQVARPSAPITKGDVTMHEAVLVAHVGACRASLRAIRPSAANADRLEMAERALDRAEDELYLFRKSNSARIAVNDPSAA